MYNIEVEDFRKDAVHGLLSLHVALLLGGEEAKSLCPGYQKLVKKTLKCPLPLVL